MFTIYHADCVGRAANCLYPHAVQVTDREALARAVSHDYVCAAYRDSCRSNENFLGADCLPVDCDNDHSENPEDWIRPADVAEAFPGVAFAVHFSRNHMKEKNGRAARPKFHVLFAIDPVTDAVRYAALKRQVCEMFPFFDVNALDAARFFFGTREPEVGIFEGPMTLTAFLADAEKADEEDFDAGLESGFESLVIPEGSRNSTLSRIAGKLLKRWGDTQETRRRFEELAGRCVPPLEQAELDAIWRSALRFYDRVARQPDYVPPEQYNAGLQLMPGDFSDVGQALVLSAEYGEKLRYSPATDYLVYNGRFWEESEPKAQGVAQELTERQLKEAETALKKATDEMAANGAWAILASMGPKRAADAFSPQQALSYQKYETATAFRNYAIRRRDSKYISSALKEARPMLELDPKQLDADEFLLNTPSATWDLRRGLADAREHRPSDYITKMTAVDPSEEGSGIWQAALETFFPGDPALIDYVQEVAGLAAIGKVHVEALLIAYGEGRNGKSTFWNTISRVMGSYSGNMSADTLTVGCKRNVKPELAEVRGKRLVIAAEMEEGMRLNTSTVKQLCSTDDIFAEKKYKTPFAFTPTHSLVLYTNHLPRVGALDAGTWRRLIVIPFNAKIEGGADIRNYADFLFEKAGGAVLAWIIEGARRVIDGDYRIAQPQVVRDAIARYRRDNDWLAHFLEDCCELDGGYREKSGELYNAYRSYSAQMGEYTRGTTDFYTALESSGFERKKTAAGMTIFGLRLRTDFLD